VAHRLALVEEKIFMISIKDLTKIYAGNVPALQGLTLEIGAGMFGLVGPNGAGKTSLMRILAGLVEPTSGDVHIFGHDVTTAPGKMAVKAHLGYLPQELGLYPTLTATEFLDYIALLKGFSDKATRRQQVREVLAQVRLSDVADRRLKTYSGGMKRRVGIAQALLGQPQLVIVDEPTVGLDPEERVRLRNLLSDLATRCTVILSTHIIEDISQSCRALAVIGQGRLLFHGSPSELVEPVRGRVWVVDSDGSPPSGDVTIVSSIQFPHTTQYRVLGQPNLSAQYLHQTEPTLEDGYMWLMRQANGT
jgi:ABC-type multidrug transport system ATPase subunit